MNGWWASMTPALWLVVGLGLMILEVFAPGAFLIWFGLAALSVGSLLWLFPSMAWPLQWFLFALLSIGALLGYRALRKRHPAPAAQQPLLNKRAEQLVGRVFALDQGIDNGRGKIKIGDALWTVTGPDMPTGSRIRVVSVRDQLLEVVAE